MVHYKYELPPLPYAYDALEPYIDALTMKIHYTKHHQAYVNNLNKALESHKDLHNIPLEQLLKDLNSLPESVRTAIRNNGGGDYNHSMFWLIMKPNGGGEPNGKVGQSIRKKFGDFRIFQDQFNVAAKTVFGSGWAWLCVTGNGDIEIVATANQDSPLTDGKFPIMGLDVWEHAYYLKYQNKRPDYINAWWHVINWDMIEENYRRLIE